MNPMNWLYFKRENNLCPSIFTEAKQDTTDLTYLSQLLTKLSFRTVKTNEQADGMISRYKKVVEKGESGQQTTEAVASPSCPQSIEITTTKS